MTYYFSEIAYLRSVLAIRAAKLAGRRGDSVKGRLPRTMLNNLMRRADSEKALALYREFAGHFAISITTDEAGCPRHDYKGLLGVSKVVLNWTKDGIACRRTLGDLSDGTASLADNMLARAKKAGYTAFLSLA
jgi:hypothetical protein